MAGVEIRLLGPVGVWAGGTELDIGPSKRRAVLAVLAMRLGLATSPDQIIDFVWDDAPPPRARRVVIVHVSRLRAILDGSGVALRTVPAGYVLNAPPDRIDAHRFRAAVASAQDRPGAAERSAALREALGLWRGDALSGIGDSDARRPMAAGLERLRLDALERRIAADLDAGRHAELGPELAELVARHPTHERFSVALMHAAWRSGNRTGALDEYARLRRDLQAELGITPGPEALALFKDILRAEEPAKPDPQTPSRPGRMVSQLPASARIFEGRADRLAQLDALASGADREPVVVISGMGGVGKTALALRWAGSAADRFPDGQLYVDLRGFDGRQPLTSLAALTRLLVAAGAPQAQVPTELDAAAGTYRALLADRRTLVVLDNARSAAQVRELLPGGRGNLVLVTSRNALTGLVARDDALAMPLGVLRPAESVALIERLFAQSGLTAAPSTTRDLADLCGHLPLAIRILAANLATGTGPAPAEMVSILRAGARLSVLEIRDDPASALALVFEHSYHPLDPADRRLFRLLGAAPCVDYTTGAAAALVGEEPTAVAAALRRLVAANMVTEIDVDRVGFHDLIRELAVSASTAEDDDGDRVRAGDRLAGWYLGFGVAAHGAISPHLAPIVPRVAFAEGPYPFGTDSAAAMASVGAEAANLRALVADLVARDRDEVAWEILASLFHTLDRGGSVGAAIDLLTEALAVAVRRGDRMDERRARINLAACYNNANRPAEAIAHLERAIELAREQGARDSEASAQCNLGVSYKKLNDADRALEAFFAAHRLRPDAPNCAVLNNIGNIYCNRGDYERAGTYLNEALEVARAAGTGSDEAMSMVNLGCLDLARGRHDAALRGLRAAYDVASRVGAARVQVTADIDLARVNDRLGRLDESRMHLNRALDLARKTGSTGREQEITDFLARLAGRAGSAD